MCLTTYGFVLLGLAALLSLALGILLLHMASRDLDEILNTDAQNVERSESTEEDLERR